MPRYRLMAFTSLPYFTPIEVVAASDDEALRQARARLDTLSLADWNAGEWDPDDVEIVIEAVADDPDAKDRNADPNTGSGV